MRLRSILAILLLVLVFAVAGVGELWAALLEIELRYIFYLLLLAVVMIWASCLKWQLFVRAGGHDAKILSLMKLYTIGYFFNTFTPSYVGGDVARSYHLGKDLKSQKHAFAATFLERFTGLLAMSFLGLMFVAIGTEATAGVEIAILVVGLGAVILALICFSESIGRICFSVCSRLTEAVFSQSKAVKINGLLQKIEEAISYARNSPVLFGKAMLYSFLFHILTVINTYVAALSVGWENPDFGGLFVVVPLVLLVGMAPITPSGLGIQEGAFLFFLQRVGGTTGQSLGVGVVLRAKIFLIALVGWVLWLGLEKTQADSSDTASRTSDEEQLLQKEIGC